MKHGDRIKIIAGPWPERIGAEGQVVESDAKVYPWYKRGKDEVVVLLDHDPLNSLNIDERGQRWTCSYLRADVQPLYPAP